MTTATVNEPVSGYDRLKTKEVIASLSSRSQVELAEIESYEHAHQDRVSVFDKLRWLRQDEPLPGYDALSSDELVAALDKADIATIKRVRGYERKFRARREVLEEVDRLHRERRAPLASRDSKFGSARASVVALARYKVQFRTESGLPDEARGVCTRRASSSPAAKAV